MNEIDVYAQPSYSEFVKLYHLANNYREDRLLNFKFRKKPTDSPLLIHDIVNKLSVKKFKIPIRNLFFTYSRPLNDRAMRVIPLGNNVQYFYHPDIEDFTAWIYSDITPEILNDIEDFMYQYDLDVSYSDLRDIWENQFPKNKGLSVTYNETISDFNKVLDKKMSTKLTKLIFTTILSKLKEYVENIRYTTDIEDIPNDTESEIMIYAPDDIYLIANKKKV